MKTEPTADGNQGLVGGDFSKRQVPPEPIRRELEKRPEDVKGGLFDPEAGSESNQPSLFE